ncbi:hypothetical protein J2S98_002562 [Arthrobacter oryzae]|uniref:ATP-binding protein n=1 Tax=Arthrobacter oryzae TaxID=409290 RepID=UPI00278B0656|nr:hypothetical protein [Arthrobacter oryzae]
MHIRPLSAHVEKISHRRFGWVASVPWLTDSIDDGERFGIESLDRGYLNLAEAIANASPESSSLQLRILSKGANDESGGAGVLTAWLVATADNPDGCRQMWDLVSATLPAELPLQPGDDRAAKGVFNWPQSVPIEGVVEIRRRIEDARPVPGITVLDPAEATVLQWDVAPNSLRTLMGLLTRQPGKSALVLHMERVIPSEALLMRAADIFKTAVAGVNGPVGGEYGPMLRRIADEARHRLRVFPRGALHVRVAIASDHELVPGLAESVAMDLTSVGGADITKPDDSVEFTDALGLFREGESRSWRAHPDSEIEELRYMSDPAEASLVVRFPQPPRGGLPGIASAPMVTLPRSPQPPALHGGAGAVTLGVSPHGGRVTLTLGELNQHTLVMGLPGFGKTHSVHTVLRQLWNDHGIPFLVLDPAKGDYGGLIDSLRDRPKAAPQRVVLDPEHVAFNPFVVPPGSSVHAHAGRVLGAFDAALQISARWPAGYLTLSRGLFRAYEQCPAGEWPTLRSLYAAVGDLIRTTPMDPKSKADVTAGLLGRLESMVRGPLGVALTGGPTSGIDWHDLLNRPTVIEFRGFAGPAERSLVFGLLIAGLASVRENAEEEAGKGLQHVTVLEEAHRVLGHTGTTEAEGVRLLAEAIAELRGSGEGFLVVDQTPTVLHPVVRKVCGSLLTHRLVEREEREAAGSALLLDPRQIEDLGRLAVGQAVVYGAARVSAAVVNVTPPDATITLTRRERRASLTNGRSEPLFCLGCSSMCKHQNVGRAMAEQVRSGGGSAEDLLTRASLMQRSPDELWCAAAHATADEFQNQRQTAMLNALHDRRQQLVSVVLELRSQSGKTTPTG